MILKENLMDLIQIIQLPKRL